MNLNAHNGFRASGLQGFRASGLQGFRASGRDSVADSLRGLAIILVVIGHVFKGFEDSRIILPDSFLSVAGYYFIYTFHMPLMFMISGYVHGIKERYTDGRGYLYYFMKNAVDLYLPCLYFSFIVWLPKFFMFSFLHMENTEGLALVSMDSLRRIPLNGASIYWFLCSLFFVKILHLFFESLIGDKYIHSVIWAVIFIITALCGGIVPAFFRQFHYGLYFHAGFFMRRKNIITQENRPGLIWGIILLIAGVLSFALSYMFAGGNNFSRILCAVCMSLSAFVIFYALDVKNSFLVLCGLYSMMIYIPHNSIIVVMKIILRFLGLSSLAGQAVILSSVLFFLVALFVPLGVAWLYKNVKCLRWIKYIFYPGELILRK